METDLTDIADVAAASRLSVVGTAKNCGKTTTLNALLEHRRRQQLPMPALCSVGIDGESTDALLGTDKPPIRVTPDQWVVSAEQALRRSTARFEYVRSMGHRTPLGEVFVCRVIAAGTAILGGLRHLQDLRRAIELLEDLGIDDIWIDGAYGRLIGTHPDLADGAVVATGAVVAESVDGVVDATTNLVSRLDRPAISDPLHRTAIEQAIARDRVMVVDDEGDIDELHAESALLGLDELDDLWEATTRAVAIPGLISDRVAEELLALGRDHTLLVPDPTVLHIDDSLWRRLRNQWDIRSLRAADIAGISYNPTSIDGRRLDSRLLRRDLGNIRPSTPVFNPLQ